MTGSSPTPDEIDRRFAEIISDLEPRPAPREDAEPFSFDSMFETAEVDDVPYIPPPAERVPFRAPFAIGFALIAVAVIVAFARLAGAPVPNDLGLVTGLGGVGGLALLLAQAWRRKPGGDS